ncbi:MAG: hypothetical protein GOV02_03660 [Candidatus Aenigmarchaeota archaeon]|nr:hypothetical protein [Candidatus Aenigmarchaeota archaeon]
MTEEGRKFGLKDTIVSSLLFFVLGIGLGYVSFLWGDSLGALGLMIFGFVAASDLMKRALGFKESFKWFFTNGGLIYFFTWFVVWMLLYNL